MYVYVFIYLKMYLSICLFIYLLFYLSISSFTYLVQTCANCDKLSHGSQHSLAWVNISDLRTDWVLQTTLSISSQHIHVGIVRETHLFQGLHGNMERTVVRKLEN